MKIAILGFSGSGKSTLAKKLGQRYGVPVLHFDSVQFLPGWQERPLEEKLKITEEFLNTNDQWVIDGNYTKLFYQRRLEEADKIIILMFNRFACLWRVIRRYFTYRHTTRPDMGEGCPEKIDREFVMWVLRDGRKRAAVARHKDIAKRYPNKTVIIRNQRQLNKI